MARQLDFSPLDRRNQILQSQALRSNVLSKTISDVGQVAGKVIGENNKRRKQLLEATSFDDDLTNNAVVNDYFIEKFENEVRQPILDSLNENRFNWVAPKTVNELMLLQKKYERELGLGKNMVDQWNKAKLISQDPKNFGVYELDQDKWSGFKDIMTGEYKENLSAYMRSALQHGEVQENPFLRIKPVENIDSTINFVLNDAMKQVPQDENVLIQEANERGMIVTETNRSKVVDEAKKQILKDVSLGLLLSKNSMGKYGDIRSIAKGAKLAIFPDMPSAVDGVAAISFLIDKMVEDMFGEESEVVVSEKQTEKKQLKKQVIEPEKEVYFKGKKGNEVKTKLGASSSDFVSYSQAPYKERVLKEFILPEDSYTISEMKGMNVPQDLRGVSMDYEILGYDREKNNFWLVPLKERKERVDRKDVPFEEVVVLPGYRLGVGEKSEQKDFVIGGKKFSNEEILRLYRTDPKVKEKYKDWTDSQILKALKKYSIK
jgi:hypothetical protein